MKKILKIFKKECVKQVAVNKSMDVKKRTEKKRADSIVVQNRKQMAKKGLALVLLLAIIGVTIALAVIGIKRINEQKYLDSFGKIVASVGSYDITFDVYRSLYMTHFDGLEATKENALSGAALHAECKRRTNEQLKNLYAIAVLAAENKMSANDADILAAVEGDFASLRKYFAEEELDYKEFFEEAHLTENAFKKISALSFLQTKLFNYLVADGVIESDDARVLSVLTGDDFVFTKSIFLKNETDEEKEENRILAEKLIFEYNRGISFDELLKHSEDKYMPDEGYFFTRGERTPEYETAAFALKEGEISGVVECDGGYYVILRVKKDAKYITDNLPELKSQYQTAFFRQLLSERAARLSVNESEYLLSLSSNEIRGK